MSKSETMDIYTHFENTDCTINISWQNKFRNSLFSDELSKCLDIITITPNYATIISDLNFHVDNQCDVEAHMFYSILDSHGLT